MGSSVSNLQIRLGQTSYKQEQDFQAKHALTIQQGMH